MRARARIGLAVEVLELVAAILFDLAFAALERIKEVGFAVCAGVVDDVEVDRECAGMYERLIGVARVT